MPPCRFGEVRSHGDAARCDAEGHRLRATMGGSQELFRGLCTRNRPLALLEKDLKKILQNVFYIL